MFFKIYPVINRWINEQGWIEIGQNENSQSLVRAIDDGGLVWESDDMHISIDLALQDLEIFLKNWYNKNIKIK
jgi:hypothetical protein